MNKLIHSVIDIIRKNRKHARIVRKHKQLQKQYPNIKIIR